MSPDDQEFLAQITKRTLLQNYVLLLGQQLNRLMRLAKRPENPSWDDNERWAVRREIIDDLIKEIRKN